MTEKAASLILAYMCTRRLQLRDANNLCAVAGSAKDALTHIADIDLRALGVTEGGIEMLTGDLTEAMTAALAEEMWCMDNGVRVICPGEADYPVRMASLPDAPRAIFVRGKCNLNSPHALGVVGTRRTTPYGDDWTRKMVTQMSHLCADTTIVSGLAYGIDINAHRTAMDCAMDTVAVVAHGQDYLYPAMHRHDADRMTSSGHGAVVTEYFHGTRPESRNFLQRNRIIAAMSDATIVVESASHGGGLVTADCACRYGRKVFAVPGSVTAEMSAGCNKIIRSRLATLVTSAEDIMQSMGWQADTTVARARRQGIERQLFPELSPLDKLIIGILREGDTHADVIASRLAQPISTIVASLFTLEMKGIIRALPGNRFHAVN